MSSKLGILLYESNCHKYSYNYLLCSLLNLMILKQNKFWVLEYMRSKREGLGKVRILFAQIMPMTYIYIIFNLISIIF